MNTLKSTVFRHRGGYSRLLIFLLALVMTLIMSVPSFADVTVTKSWDDNLSGASANSRSAPTVNIQGETSYEKLLNLFYPVGTSYDTYDSSFNPKTAWGGEWTCTTVIDDYVVEEGTEDIWHYRKWSSGVAECWGLVPAYSRTLAGWGNITYSSGTDPSYNYPSGLFIDEPSVNISCSMTAGSWIAPMIAGGSAATSPRLCPASTSGQSSTTIKEYIQASGYWKSYTASETTYRWKRTA